MRLGDHKGKLGILGRWDWLSGEGRLREHQVELRKVNPRRSQTPEGGRS